ncbi:MAG TPA: hypothetical protein VEL80_04500 [Burkholderiales bacterium]|nr:hypothetical protein [Burkholderiales bacterium]
MRMAFATAAMVLLGGCSSLAVSNLGEPPVVNTNSISLFDKRTVEQKEPRRDSVMSPMSVLGDANVQPPAILFLQSSLQKRQKQASSLRVEINELYIIDFFPARLKAATYSGGWLTDAVVKNIIHSNTDWKFVNDIGVPIDGNSIVCLFSGAINGRAVKAAAFHQYYASPMAISIRNDPAFTNAVKLAIDKAASEILSQLEN